MTDTYHHGDLRSAILEAAARAVIEDGPHHLSLRALARQAGVSHTAPRHHFGDKLGMTTALADHGYELLADALRTGYAANGLEGMGVAYVMFARAHRGHFAVMFQPDLVRHNDVEGPGGAAHDVLRAAVVTDAPAEDADIGTLRRWSTAHGLAVLATSGMLRDLTDPEVEAMARQVLATL